MVRTYSRGQVLRLHVNYPTPRCHEHGRYGGICTRAFGHSGRHSAGGIRRADGTCEVFEVWGDEPAEVAEPCS